MCGIQAQGLDYVVVFFSLEGAGGVDQHTLWSENFERVYEQHHLSAVQLFQIRRLKAPFYFGVASQSASSGAGGVEKNAFEAAAER